MFGLDIPWRLVVIGSLVLAVLGALGGQYVTIQHLRAGLAEQKAAIAQERANAAQAAADEQARNRLEEQRRTAAQTEIANESQRLTARARAGDVHADDGDRRLRDATAAAAAACRGPAGDPAAAAASPAASSPGDLLALVQRRMGEAARGVVRFADDASIAGETCQRAYDALMPPPLKFRLGTSNAHE